MKKGYGAAHQSRCGRGGTEESSNGTPATSTPQECWSVTWRGGGGLESSPSPCLSVCLPVSLHLSVVNHGTRHWLNLTSPKEIKLESSVITAGLIRKILEFICFMTDWLACTSSILQFCSATYEDDKVNQQAYTPCSLAQGMTWLQDTSSNKI
jgi:hypothetical protein